jgi:hypothetical protein
LLDDRRIRIREAQNMWIRWIRIRIQIRIRNTASRVGNRKGEGSIPLKPNDQYGSKRWIPSSCTVRNNQSPTMKKGYTAHSADMFIFEK